MHVFGLRIRRLLRVKKIVFHMEHEQILEKLASNTNQQYSLHIDNKRYQIKVDSLAKSKIPVRKPTTRGGVYFTDTMAYKIKAITSEMSLKDQLPSLMLGPSTDFKPVLVKTIQDNVKITLVTHLTNAVSSKDRLELNLIVDKVTLD